MNKPYIIIEAANTHGGDFKYLVDLVDSFSEYKGNFGIKFQAFHPDRIATKSFSFYNVYKNLFFDQEKWKEVVKKASETKDVWLDVFDTYGVEILNKNFNNISGIKFQSSVLQNNEVFTDLLSTTLVGKKLIVNIAAQRIDDIREIICTLNTKLKPEEILIEFGYQAYPTTFLDSGFSKYIELKKNFTNRFVFADHIDANSEDAIWLPTVMAMNGVEVIEKHVMLDGRETKYDHFSSLNPSQFKNMIEKVSKYCELKDQPFINDREIQYLRSTIMVPILNKNKAKGTLIDFSKDIIFRRTGEEGLTLNEIKKLQHTLHILANDKNKGETLKKEDFKKANIATIIACRLKSSRLPQKALLPIGNLPSVERCIKSCLAFQNVNYTVLATSDLEEDSELANYTYRSDVIFHKGDPDDVIRRYLGIAEKLNIDVIIRITADMPFVSNEIVEQTLHSHFCNGADYTVPKSFAVGTSAEIINTESLQKIKKHFKSANYSEYMTWYFQNNPEHFNLNFIDLPNDLIRDYRLTLDYPEDLEMFNKLQSHFDTKHIEFNIKKVFEFLDQNPDVNAINSHLTLRYKNDPELIKTLNEVTRIKKKV